MSGWEKELDQRRGGEPSAWRKGRWPVLLATAVALIGPVLLVLFPSQVMFWVMWLFMVPLLLLWIDVTHKAEKTGKEAPEDTQTPRAQDVWWPPSDL